MLYALIPVLLLTLAAVSLSLLLKKRFADMLAPVMFSVILILYGFYIFDALAVGRLAVIALFLLLYAAAAVHLVRRKDRKKALLEIVSTPAFAMYLAALAVFLLFSANKFVNMMDCLRLWGAYPKILHSNGEFQLGNNSFLFVYMQSYPPGMPLLCYFLTSFSDTFSESTLFFTYSFFGFSLILPFFGGLDQQNIKSLLPGFLAAIFLPWIITGINTDEGYYYSSLFIDIPLGICCGYFLFRAFHRVDDAFESICMILSCSSLALLKDSGALLALCGILGGLVCGILRKKELPLFRGILRCAAALLLLGAVFGSWRYLMALNGVVNDAQINLSGFSFTALARIGFYFIRTPITGFYSITGTVVLALPAILLVIFTAKLLLTSHNPQERNALEWADVLCQFFCYAIFFIGYCIGFMQDILRQHYPSYVRYFCTLAVSAAYTLTADCVFRHKAMLAGFRTEISGFLQKDYAVTGLIRSASRVLRAALILSVIFASVLILFDVPSKQQPLNLQAAQSAETAADCIPEGADVYLCVPAEEIDYAKLHHLIYFELLDEGIRIKNYFPAAVITDPSQGYDCESFLSHLIDNGYQHIMLTSLDEAILTEFSGLFGDASPEDTNLVYQVDAASRQLIRIR